MDIISDIKNIIMFFIFINLVIINYGKNLINERKILFDDIF